MFDLDIIFFSLAASAVIVLIGIVIFIISAMGKNRLMESENEIIRELHKFNKDTVESLNKEIEYLNSKKPEWGLTPVANKIRDVTHYQKTQSEIEEIVEIMQFHNKKFDDMFDDTEINIYRYEAEIEKFYKEYRKHNALYDKSFPLSKILYDNNKTGYLERAYKVISKDKYKKQDQLDLNN